VSGNRPERVLDPVCGMTVAVVRAEEDGLTLEVDGRTYAFCRLGCMRAFSEEPDVYAAGATQATQSAPAIGEPRATGLPVIDEGMRLWYESCSCCLSDAFPEVKAALDAERAASASTPVAAGICEVAERQELAAP
jgi:YHS domain-containing protein